MNTSQKMDPWVADAPGTGDNESQTHWEVFDGMGRVATVYGEPAESERDARRIAKVPDLANALRRLLNSPDLLLESLEAETLDAIDEAEEALSGFGLLP